MRILAIDVGRRRIGLAISDATATLARPLETVTVERGSGLAQVADVVRRLTVEDDGLGAIIIGWPRRLDGSPSAESPGVAKFADGLRALTSLPIAFEDERLTSVEAESRLAIREKDWRRRKARLDAAAAAVFLQDYLDRQAPAAGIEPDEESQS
jgi:putative Holliday junction resolvase